MILITDTTFAIVSTLIFSLGVFVCGIIIGGAIVYFHMKSNEVFDDMFEDEFDKGEWK